MIAARLCGLPENAAGADTCALRGATLRMAPRGEGPTRRQCGAPGGGTSVWTPFRNAAAV